jgi:hypothetical protein
MAPKSSEFEQEMEHHEAQIKRLEAEYNMFFAGRLPRLPWETRARVEALVKRYDRMHLRNTAEKFRFGTLQSRFAAFSLLWERSLQAREEGRPRRGRRTGATAAPVNPPATKPAPTGPAGTPAPPRAASAQPQKRVVAVSAFRDPATEAERLSELYDRLSAARKEAGEKPVPFESFKQVVRAQVNKLGGGQAEVAFRVTVEGGKVTMTAKALKESK